MLLTKKSIREMSSYVGRMNSLVMDTEEEMYCGRYDLTIITL